MNFVRRRLRFNLKSEAFWITLIYVVWPLLVLFAMLVIPRILR
jgi:hypothetical protein